MKLKVILSEHEQELNLELYTALVRERHYYIDFLELIKIIYLNYKCFGKLVLSPFLRT